MLIQKDFLRYNDIFKHITETYADMIMRICILRCGNKADAEDCWQNTFLKLWKHNEIVTDDNSEHIKSWLIRVAVNECKNHHRFLSRHKTTQLETCEALNSVYESHSDTEMFTLVMSLKPDYRDVIYLYYYEKYSVAEIAKLTNTRENTVKSRLKRAREKLKSELEDDYS